MSDRTQVRADFDFGQYTIEVHMEDDGSFFASIPELSGCMAAGDDANTAVELLSEVFEEWVQDRIEHGESIPAPFDADAYSGRVLIRLPKSLHGEIAKEAKRQQTSINSWVMSQLSLAVGRSSVQTEVARAYEKALSGITSVTMTGIREAGMAIGAYGALSDSVDLLSALEPEDLYMWPIGAGATVTSECVVSTNPRPQYRRQTCATGR